MGKIAICQRRLIFVVGEPKAFTRHYMFKHNNVVVLKTVAGKNLRVTPGDTAKLDGDVVSFKAVKTGKYLRILPNDSVNAGAAGNGPFTKFQVHKQGNGKVKLESKKRPGNYPAFRNGKVLKGTGGDFTVFEVFRQK